MSSPYLPESTAFKQLNSIDLVAFNIATAIWGANTCNSALFAFASTHSLRTKLVVAWLWAVTTISQGLTTTEVKLNYVLWGFIRSDSTIRSPPLTNVINFMAGLVAASSQAFFAYEIWKSSRKLHFIPIFSAPPILFQIVVSLSSIVAPSTSLLDFYRKDLVLTTLFVNAILNACLFFGLSRVFAPRYFSVVARKENAISFTFRVLLFSINAGFWIVLVSISNIAMFYFLYSYSSLFVLYAHLTTSVYFLSLLSFLGSVHHTDDDAIVNAHFTSSAARARMRNANARSMVVDGEDLYFKHSVSLENGRSINDGL